MKLTKKISIVVMATIMSVNILTMGANAYSEIEIAEVTESNNESAILNLADQGDSITTYSITDSQNSYCTVTSYLSCYPSENRVYGNGAIKNNTSKTCSCSLGTDIYTGKTIPTDGYHYDKTQNVGSGSVLNADPKYRYFSGTGTFSTRAYGQITYNGYIYSARATDISTYK